MELFGIIAVRVRELAGPWFYAVHLLLFVLGTPALANVIVLRPRPKYFRGWFVAVPLCTVLAFGLVLMQYVVSEALYGIEGQDGPFRGDPLSISRSRISDQVDLGLFADFAIFDSRANVTS